MNRMLAMVLMASLFLSGCGGQYADRKPVTGKLNYVIIDTDSESFRKNNELSLWFEDNYQAKDIYTKDLNGKTYILVSAGMRPTGGYRMQVVDVVADDEITVTTRILKPSNEQGKTMVLTYPHVLIAIDQDSRNVIWEDITGAK